MSEGRGRARAPVSGLLMCALLAGAARAEPAPEFLELPFAVRAVRGPGSEVALAAATSGLLAGPGAKPGTRTRPADGTVAVVWGEAGGAVLVLAEGRVRPTLIGAEAAANLAAPETPRGGLPGLARVQAGPLSAVLEKEPGRADRAARLTIRERQPVAPTAEPRPVPVATAHVPAGTDATFAGQRPHLATLDGRAALVAVLVAADGPVLALVGREAGGGGGDGDRDDWRILARTPVAPRAAAAAEAAPRRGDEGLRIAAVADFTGTGTPQVATLGPGTRLRLWQVGAGGFALLHEAEGYAADPDGTESAAVLPPERDGPGQAARLALPTAERGALAVLSVRGGALREAGRVPLPAATRGITALGRGDGARVLVVLADGRVAVVAPEAAPVRTR